MGRGGPKHNVEEFLDKVSLEHYENWRSKNHYNIKIDKIMGMRLDHQGENQDGTHRIWVQPLPGGKSRGISGLNSKDYVARVVVTDGASPADVKKGLVMSAGKEGHDYKVDSKGVTW